MDPSLEEFAGVSFPCSMFELESMDLMEELDVSYNYLLPLFDLPIGDGCDWHELGECACILKEEIDCPLVCMLPKGQRNLY
jgi:hypothetical protein